MAGRAVTALITATGPAKPAALDGDEDQMYPLLRPKEVAVRLGCSEDHVSTLMATGEIPFVTIASRAVGSRGDSSRVAKRVRSDHLRAFVLDRTEGGE